MIAEYDNAGRVVAQYTHGVGLGADVGSVISREDLAGVYYYIYNHRGDVINITGSSGSVLNSYRYDAFGNIIDNEGSLANNILFSGKRYDIETGLSYFGARWYDATIGRFISADPLGYIDGPNEYVLSGNNPLLFIDPMGFSKLLASLTNEQKTQIVNSQNYLYNLQQNTSGYINQSTTPNVFTTVSSPVNVVTLRDPNTGGSYSSATISMPVISSASNSPIGMDMSTSGSSSKTGIISRAWNGIKSLFGFGNDPNYAYTKHAIERMQQRNISKDDINDAIKNPIKKGDIKYDEKGRPSQRYTGTNATVEVNPENNKVITVWPTSSRTKE